MASVSRKAGKKDGTRVEGWDSGFASRLGAVVSQLGGNGAAGEIAGVTDEMISRYLNGKAKPNLYSIAAIAKAGGVSLDWLLWDERPIGRRGGHGPVEVARFIEVMDEVKAAYEAAGGEADGAEIGEATARIYGQTWDIEDDAEFRGGLRVAVNSLKRELRKA